MSILIGPDTTFIVQGITGREAVNLTRECLDYASGAKIVGGVTPGRRGRDVHGVPVYDTVAQCVEAHGGPIDGSVVTVPPAFTKDAVFEAIENAIKLIVIVTERIPRRDVAQMVELASMRGARIIGPNCLGIIVPDVIKMGGIGGPAKNGMSSAYVEPMIASPPIETAVDWPRPAAVSVEDISVVMPPERLITPIGPGL